MMCTQKIINNYLIIMHSLLIFNKTTLVRVDGEGEAGRLADPGEQLAEAGHVNGPRRSVVKR